MTRWMPGLKKPLARLPVGDLSAVRVMSGVTYLTVALRGDLNFRLVVTWQLASGMSQVSAGRR